MKTTGGPRPCRPCKDMIRGACFAHVEDPFGRAFPGHTLPVGFARVSCPAEAASPSRPARLRSRLVLQGGKERAGSEAQGGGVGGGPYVSSRSGENRLKTSSNGNENCLPRSTPGPRAPRCSQETPRSPKSRKKAAPELPPERPVQGCACDSRASCQSIHPIVSPNSLFWGN